jgi:hypothetical protein
LRVPQKYGSQERGEYFQAATLEDAGEGLRQLEVIQRSDRQLAFLLTALLVLASLAVTATIVLALRH